MTFAPTRSEFSCNLICLDLESVQSIIGAILNLKSLETLIF